ncbi:DNA-directed RNA polymerase subunit F [Candidatus Mancarchaeum acidiphilum]|uniref:DNA-directed RNA polymerase subunit F n=1 Tax=Candidatus Mancarchaeum acidiphilum TaxID=1920749 RepID=A0A218NLZ1_9ARCH|nr:hypothetical protein [Candidatus Mancarchaeum acidiphilum]ASI13484.1 DNA-directed RNA polymerase subunit F [Candidatus Mancarchaeum acidiphilum]
MIGEDFKEEGSLSLNEVYDILSKRKEESELSYEQKMTFEYAEKFQIPSAKFKKIKSDLEAMELNNNLINKLLELNPKSPEVIKYAAASNRVTLDEEQINKILSEFKSV